jgi:hypothetical protein
MEITRGDLVDVSAVMTIPELSVVRPHRPKTPYPPLPTSRVRNSFHQRSEALSLTKTSHCAGRASDLLDYSELSCSMR